MEEVQQPTGAQLSEKMLLQYLAPDPHFLKEESVAVNLFQVKLISLIYQNYLIYLTDIVVTLFKQEITYLTFSREEILSMIAIAIALSIMVSAITFIIYIASRRTIYTGRSETIIVRALRWLHHKLRGLINRVGCSLHNDSHM